MLLVLFRKECLERCTPARINLPLPATDEKYNTVLRAKSGNEFLMAKFGKVCKGNFYTTTIHAINSVVIKLSKLTVACPVYRGLKDAAPPGEFWVANSFNVMGGIEYGFSSTTTDRSKAVHFATAGGQGQGQG